MRIAYRLTRRGCGRRVEARRQLAEYGICSLKIVTAGERRGSMEGGGWKVGWNTEREMVDDKEVDATVRGRRVNNSTRGHSSMCALSLQPVTWRCDGGPLGELGYGGSTQACRSGRSRINGRTTCDARLPGTIRRRRFTDCRIQQEPRHMRISVLTRKRHTVRT